MSLAGLSGLPAHMGGSPEEIEAAQRRKADEDAAAARADQGAAAPVADASVNGVVTCWRRIPRFLPVPPRLRSSVPPFLSRFCLMFCCDRAARVRVCCVSAPPRPLLTWPCHAPLSLASGPPQRCCASRLACVSHVPVRMCLPLVVVPLRSKRWPVVFASLCRHVTSLSAAAGTSPSAVGADARSKSCANCRNDGAKLKCSRCAKVVYCNRDCQVRPTLSGYRRCAGDDERRRCDDDDDADLSS
jgi:hypothetical protein